MAAESLDVTEHIAEATHTTKACKAGVAAAVGRPKAGAPRALRSSGALLLLFSNLSGSSKPLKAHGFFRPLWNPLAPLGDHRTIRHSQ